MFYESKNEEITSYTSKPWTLYTQDLSIGFLDIETTGLSAKKNSILLGGLLSNATNLCESSYTTKQYFAETLCEEADLLHKYVTALSKHDIWISYNGDSFDLPFLTKRIQELGLCERLPFHQSFDLYRIIRRFSPIATLLPNLKQKTVEAFLGIDKKRTDEISGKESILMYETYQTQPLPELKEAILLHNQDDLSQLCGLLPILDKLDLHCILFNRGFMIADQDRRMKIERIHFNKNHLSVTGTIKNISLDYQSFELTHQINIDAKKQTFELHLPFLCEENYIFLDLESFSMDFSPLEKYEGFQSGYLILHNGTTPNYLETNHAIKIFLKELLKELI